MPLGFVKCFWAARIQQISKLSPGRYYSLIIVASAPSLTRTHLSGARWAWTVLRSCRVVWWRGRWNHGPKVSYQLCNFDVLKINNSRDFPGAECPAGSEWPLEDKTLHYHSNTLVHVLKKADQEFSFIIVAPGIVQKCGLISTNGTASLELSP